MVTRATTANVFTADAIRECEEYVLNMQRRLDKAVANNDLKGMHRLTYILSESNAVKILAVWRITYRNKGKYTAGIDGVSIPRVNRQKQNKLRLCLLQEIDLKRKPDATKRVYIPKPNGKKRPLGIPTMRDRINQEIIRIVLEPITEYHAHHSSYGFRPKRSCQDAMSQLFNLLSRKTSRKYVLEGDIKGCFDNINHAHIIRTLADWGVAVWLQKIITGWLKAGVFHNGEVYDTDTGTPQGGVISPILANVALTAFDQFCDKYKPRKAHEGVLVRYADDFVIVCKNRLEANEIKAEVADFLATDIGLTLSDEKSNITHINKGFDFLGFNFRKYVRKGTPKNKKQIRDTLLITPQREKVIDFLWECKELIKENASAKQSSLIRLLNPKIRGWCLYYRHVVSSKVYKTINYQMYIKLMRWAIRKHPNKSKNWVYKKYFLNYNGRIVFANANEKISIYRPIEIPIERFIKVKSGMRVYDDNPQTIAYWRRRTYVNAYNQIYSEKLRYLFDKQNGLCAYCDRPIKDIVNTETDHILPRADGGNDKYSNLRLLHTECHIERTRKQE